MPPKRAEGDAAEKAGCCRRWRSPNSRACRRFAERLLHGSAVPPQRIYSRGSLARFPPIRPASRLAVLYMAPQHARKESRHSSAQRFFHHRLTTCEGSLTRASSRAAPTLQSVQTPAASSVHLFPVVHRIPHRLLLTVTLATFLPHFIHTNSHASLPQHRRRRCGVQAPHTRACPSACRV